MGNRRKGSGKCGLKYKYYQEYKWKSLRDMRLSTMEKVAKGLVVNVQTLFE